MTEVERKQIARFIPGTTIYKYENDVPTIRRIVNRKNNGNEYWFNVCDHLNNIYRIDAKEIIDEWIMLNFDAIITFNVVRVNGSRDVMVCVHPTKTIQSTIPSIVCRQGVVDLFADMSKNAQRFINDNINYVGMSIREDTCPANVDFKLMVACDELESTHQVAFYLTDDLDTILRFVPNKTKFNRILANIKSAIDAANAKSMQKIYGYCSSLEELLKNNRFMYDLHEHFNIKEVPFNIESDEEVITDNRVAILSSILHQPIAGRIFVLPYDKSIDLDSIKRDYVLGIPMNDTSMMYIIGYDIIK